MYYCVFWKGLHKMDVFYCGCLSQSIRETRHSWNFQYETFIYSFPSMIVGFLGYVFFFSGDIKMQLFILKTIFMYLICTPSYGLLAVSSFYSWYFLLCSFAKFINHSRTNFWLLYSIIFWKLFFVLLIFLSWVLFYSLHFWRGIFSTDIWIICCNRCDKF